MMLSLNLLVQIHLRDDFLLNQLILSRVPGRPAMIFCAYTSPIPVNVSSSAFVAEFRSTSVFVFAAGAVVFAAVVAAGFAAVFDFVCAYIGRASKGAL